jgi:uridine kinase
MVTVRFPSGIERSFPAGTRVAEAAADPAFPRTVTPLVAALANNELVSLAAELSVSVVLAPVELASRTGLAVYRRSLCFLLSLAARQEFPGRRLAIGHALGHGYLYWFEDAEEVPDAEVAALQARMRALVDADRPIALARLAWAEAVAYFEDNDQPDTALLLRGRSEPVVRVASCAGAIDLDHGPLVPSTGVLGTFSVMPFPTGLLLRYPPAETPLAMGPFVENPVLVSIYREYKRWGKILRVGSVGRLNGLIRDGGIREFIEVAEALQDRKIAEIADRINARRDSVRVVLIAGPSSSGKTTFSKRLMVQLRVVGRNPVTISLDDYFLARDRTPRDEQGNPDYEALGALDVALLNEHLLALTRGDEVELPSFDFHTGSRRPGPGSRMRLPERSVLILEGIHGLNADLTPQVPREAKYLVYVSALTQLNLDDHNRIPTTDNRLVRRLVRDSQFRGHDAVTTLQMWPSVRRGEERWIFPFQNGADSAFNSALDYELAVLKVLAEPLLDSVPPDRPEYQDARSLLGFLANFAPLGPRWVPPDSILREFIGESAFKY